MQKLPLCISKNGHIYTQIIRTETKAIYQQRTKDGILAGHEVFRIKTLPKRFIFDKPYPAQEVYPGNEAFGVFAWSTGVNLEHALKKYNSLM